MNREITHILKEKRIINLAILVILLCSEPLSGSPIRNISDRGTGSMKRVNFQNQKYHTEKPLTKIKTQLMPFSIPGTHYTSRTNLKMQADSSWRMRT